MARLMIMPESDLCVKCAEPMSDDEMNQLVERQGELQGKIDFLDADWDSTSEVLNQADAMRMLLAMW